MAFTPGTYEGIGRGYRGKLPVSVTVSEDKIVTLYLKNSIILAFAFAFVKPYPAPEYR